MEDGGRRAGQLPRYGYIGKLGWSKAEKQLHRHNRRRQVRPLPVAAPCALASAIRPHPGNTVQLSVIDIKLQKLVEDMLANGAGALVAMTRNR